MNLFGNTCLRRSDRPQKALLRLLHGEHSERSSSTAQLDADCDQVIRMYVKLSNEVVSGFRWRSLKRFRCPKRCSGYMECTGEEVPLMPFFVSGVQQSQTIGAMGHGTSPGQNEPQFPVTRAPDSHYLKWVKVEPIKVFWLQLRMFGSFDIISRVVLSVRFV